MVKLCPGVVRDVRLSLKRRCRAVSRAAWLARPPAGDRQRAPASAPCAGRGWRAAPPPAALAGARPPACPQGSDAGAVSAYRSWREDAKSIRRGQARYGTTAVRLDESGSKDAARLHPSVAMRGLDPRIHVVQRARCKTWMPGTRPAAGLPSPKRSRFGFAQAGPGMTIEGIGASREERAARQKPKPDSPARAPASSRRPGRTRSWRARPRRRRGRGSADRRRLAD